MRKADLKVTTRVAATAALAGLVTVGMSACAFITPQQTTRSYTPSDGVNGSAGDVEIRNMLVVADAEGTTGSLVGALVNTASTTRTVTLRWTSSAGSQTEQVRVPAGLLSLRTDTTSSAPTGSVQQVLLDDVDTKAGGLFNVSFAQGGSSSVLRLPVLNGSLSEYATLVPTATPTPTRTKRARATATPETTDSPTPTTTP